MPQQVPRKVHTLRRGNNPVKHTRNKTAASYLIQEQSFVHCSEGGSGTLMVGEFHESIWVISRLEQKNTRVSSFQFDMPKNITQLNR
jgi:hypothetical protein